MDQATRKGNVTFRTQLTSFMSTVVKSYDHWLLSPGMYKKYTFSVSAPCLLINTLGSGIHLCFNSLLIVPGACSALKSTTITSFQVTHVATKQWMNLQKNLNVCLLYFHEKTPIHSFYGTLNDKWDIQSRDSRCYSLKYLISLDYSKISTKLETGSENRSKMCLFTLLILILWV